MNRDVTHDTWLSGGRAYVLSLLLVGVLFWPSWQDLLWLWFSGENQTYSHGLLLLALAAYLIYRERSCLAAASPPPPRYSAPLLLLLSLAWFLMQLANVQVAGEALAVLLLAAVTWATVGWRAGRSLVLAASLLLFAVPVWEVLNYPLRLLTAAGTSVLLEVVGLQNLVEATTIYIPAGTFEVSETCTGLRQLIVAMPLAMYFSYLLGLDLLRGLLVTSGAILVSLLTNIIRISINCSSFTRDSRKELSLLGFNEEQKMEQLTKKTQEMRNKYGIDILKFASEL